MGSPVSTVIANLYMEFEEQAITAAPYEPKIWKRYVDDIFTIFSNANILNDIPPHEPQLQATVEPLLSSHLLSGHLPFPRGWPLNRGSTVVPFQPWEYEILLSIEY